MTKEITLGKAREMTRRWFHTSGDKETDAILEAAIRERITECFKAQWGWESYWLTEPMLEARLASTYALFHSTFIGKRARKAGKALSRRRR